MFIHCLEFLVQKKQNGRLSVLDFPGFNSQKLFQISFFFAKKKKTGNWRPENHASYTFYTFLNSFFKLKPIMTHSR